MRARLPLLVAVACLALFAVRAASSLRSESATWDETHYFGLGAYLLEHQRWDVSGSILHPPLSYYLHGIPLLLAGLDTSGFVPTSDFLERGRTDTERGRALLASDANRGDRLLIASRLVMVAVGVLLGGFVYAWSHALYGPRAAMLAVFLYAFCPNVLAHTRLITPDIAVSAFSFVTVYLLWRFLREGRLRHALAGGICLGLALLSKYSGALLVPVAVALMLLWRTARGPVDLRGCAAFLGIGLVVLWLGYGMQIEPWFAGIAFQQAHARFGNASFLMGEHSTEGWWHYFLVALAIKTPLATLALVGAALVRLGLRARRGAWVDEAFLLLPALAVLGFFSLNHQSIGLRYVLPILPFLFVLGGEVARAAVGRTPATGFVLAMAAWLGVASWSIHPHYLAYFNEAIGGPRNGYRYLVDSNLDWGQDLKGLKRFMDERGIDEIALSYFGTDSPARYGIAYRWLPSYVLANPDPEGRVAPLKGWVAISATNLQGVYFPDPTLFEGLARRRPDATIGHSIFVYRLDDATP
jgi:hypothetical protein